MKIGILALQGSFYDHKKYFEKAGAEITLVKTLDELNQVDGLILPGGESTTMRKLIDRYSLIEPLREFAQKKPVFGTCAGMILLANDLVDYEPHLGVLDVVVKRNGFGRQVDSFEEYLNIENIGEDVHAVYIRAPFIEKAGTKVEVLARTKKGYITAVKQDNILATSFHPELTDDTRIAEYFVKMVVDNSGA